MSLGYFFAVLCIWLSDEKPDGWMVGFTGLLAAFSMTISYLLS